MRGATHAPAVNATHAQFTTHQHGPGYAQLAAMPLGATKSRSCSGQGRQAARHRQRKACRHYIRWRTCSSGSWGVHLTAEPLPARESWQRKGGKTVCLLLPCRLGWRHTFLVVCLWWARDEPHRGTAPVMCCVPHWQPCHTDAAPRFVTCAGFAAWRMSQYAPPTTPPAGLPIHKV